MTWSRQQYEDRIRDRLGDLGILQHIGEERIPLALERAIATFTKDRPRTAAQQFSGDGTTQTFDLTTDAAWEAEWSRVTSVEHPTGNIPRTYIDSQDYAIVDGLIEFEVAPDTGTNNIEIRHTAAWAFPDDDPSNDPNPIPTIYAQAIADKAAANIARGKAVEFARQQSTSVAGDLFTRDAGPLFEAAREWDAAYEETVLGRPDEPGTARQIAIAVTDVDVFPASVFHRREEYIEEETYGS